MPATTTCPACERGYRCAGCGDCPEHCKCKCEECEGRGWQRAFDKIGTYGEEFKNVDCPKCAGTGRGFVGDYIPGLTPASWAQPDRMICLLGGRLWVMGPMNQAAINPSQMNVNRITATRLGESYECYGIGRDGPQLIASWFPPEEEEQTA